MNDKEICKKCIYYDGFCCRNNKAICIDNSEYRDTEMVIDTMIDSNEKSTKYMRLISQDNLIGYCKEHRCASVPIDYIKAQKPIISTGCMSENHGHWIIECRKCKGMFDLYQTYIHCSECGKEHYYGTGDMPNFCDSCGTRMDGDTECQ